VVAERFVFYEVELKSFMEFSKVIILV